MSSINLPSANRIPDKLINAKVYYEGSAELLGIGNAELPSLEYITEALSGLGIAGEVETPVMGHFKDLPFKFSWHVPNKQAISLLASTTHHLEVYASIQHHDAGSGELVSEAVKVVLRGMPKKVGIGKIEPAKKMESETELSCGYIKMWIGGDEVLEIDKFNF
ncbi:MAG: phage major tail tube protein, partial [Desulfobulbaceae bacterium]|nr:phage major tail tube protein [Desulfobulbaceae bacterium]